MNRVRRREGLVDVGDRWMNGEGRSLHAPMRASDTNVLLCIWRKISLASSLKRQRVWGFGILRVGIRRFRSIPTAPENQR